MGSEEPAEDPALAAEIDRALAPYVGLVDAETLGFMRAELATTLLSHPVGRRLLDRVRPIAVQKSAEVTRDLVGRILAEDDADTDVAKMGRR
jgi:hypothetical protein